MKITSTLMASGAIATLMLLGGQTAEAKSPSTSKKESVVKVTVKSGDTLEKIAKKHRTTYVRLFNANKEIINPDVIDVGDKIKIPKKNEKLEDRYKKLVASLNQPVLQPSTAAPAPAPLITQPTAQSSQTFTASVPRGSSAGNTYAWGYCTWHVKNMRPDLPNMLGNGGSWVANAAAQGIATGSTPRVGAVAEQPGHVAYVTAVNNDGTISLSEMNYAGGIGQVHYRTAPASMFNYIY